MEAFGGHHEWRHVCTLHLLLKTYTISDGEFFIERCRIELGEAPVVVAQRVGATLAL